MVVSKYQHTDQTTGFQVEDLPTIWEVDTLRSTIKQLLQEFKQTLTELYGERLVGLVLYGSVARHEETPESDVDVLVVIRGETISHFDEIRRMSDAKYDVGFKYNQLISVVPMMHSELLYRESPLLRNVRREGIWV